MGPSCGLVLADLGADVIKVEPAPHGDPTRRLPGFAAGFFGTFNRNKRSLAVDLKAPEGRKLLHRLAAGADVVLENFAPGTMERLGCGYDELARRNPGLVYCSLKGFLSGPYQDRPALDEVAQFMGGLAYMTGPPGQPLRAGASVIDILGGTFGVVGILAALRERERTGKGQLVRSALFESTAYLMAQHMAGGAVTGRPVQPMPARVRAWAVYDMFDTSEGGQLFVGVTSNNHWKGFCEAFQRPDLLADPRLQSNEDRIEAQAWLLPVVRELIGRHTKAEVMRMCEKAGIPFAPVARPEDLVDDPQLNAKGRMVRIPLPGGVEAKLPGLPVELGGHDLGLRRPPPSVGEHTREVLAEAGLGKREVAELERRGVIVGEAGRK